MSKIKPVLLNGAKLGLNGILTEVSKLKRKMPVLSGLVKGVQAMGLQGS